MRIGLRSNLRVQGSCKVASKIPSIAFSFQTLLSEKTGVHLLPLKEHSEDASPSFLCLSCDHHQSSQLLSVGDSLFTPVESPQFSSEESTVLIKAVSGQQWLHVTASKVSLINIPYSERLHWTPTGRTVIEMLITPVLLLLQALFPMPPVEMAVWLCLQDTASIS